MLETAIDHVLSSHGDHPVMQLVDVLIAEAHRLSASDIHIDPTDTCVRVRLRLDGVLHDVAPLPLTLASEIITRIKILSGLRTDEHQNSQDGRFCTLIHADISLDIRVSLTPTYHGEAAVLRLLADTTHRLTLDTLGLSESNRAAIAHAIAKPHGMILTTGPTGSGKTTTLYTLLRALHTSEVSIVTIEDPIEYAITGIRQIPVNDRTGLSFATGLRSLLRQDPDIIMVGEIRDRETGTLAVNTALTGHLVLTTLHTNDAVTTLIRLLDMNIEPYLVASTVNIAIAQRLVRKICLECKERVELSHSEYTRLLHIFPALAETEKPTTYRGHGCAHCNTTGYKGRVGIYEVLVMDEIMRDLILQKSSMTQLKTHALTQGMVSLTQDGLCKVRQGITTLSEVLRVAYD
ncbi:MAG: GspE/PulE family protein [bacterium]|nr:GspE/PulE family protein [bacterium]